MVRVDKKQNPTRCCLQETPFEHKDIDKNEGIEKDMSLAKESWSR